MATYNFKKESRLHVVYKGYRYSIDIYPDYSFSQTFDETAVKVKTLHALHDMFDDARISKANPANFNFTSPLILEEDSDVLLELLTKWQTNKAEALLNVADLYFEANTDIYKLESAVFENVVFQISRDSPLLLNISGTASRLSRYIGELPGEEVIRSSTTTFSAPTYLNVILDNTEIQNINAITLELKSNVEWFQFATIHDSMNVSNASSTMYPGAFVVSGQVLSGTITQYVTDENNTTANTWSTQSPLYVEVGDRRYQKPVLLIFDIPSIVYTNRLTPDEIYTQSYDFRMNTNPGPLSSVIKKK